MSITVFKPLIKRREMHSVLSCLVTDVIGPANAAKELANSVAKKLNGHSGYAFREYGRAIEMSVDALRLEAGDKVILSPLMPVIYLKVFEKMGLVPVFADVKDSDATLSPDSVKRVLRPDTKCIYLHSPLGQVPDMDEFKQFGLPIVEDIGESLGAYCGESMLGTFGTYILISMESNGIITSGGGTLLLAGNSKAAKSLSESQQALSNESFLSDLNASLGLVQWNNYVQALGVRRKICDTLTHALAKGRYHTLQNSDIDNRQVAFSFPVIVNRGLKDVRKYAQKKGVETMLAFSNSAIASLAESRQSFPNARSLMMSTLLFPLYPTLASREIQLIAKVLAALP